ncbi:hypothetical protein BKA67DRAFT_380322 [Truncatella angustata]|uniref:Uncharacterized protein n=1 Tax=Truncatella angustata TaxID=152316 RepID=A0A9P8UFS7_9PEZI|nr:uncharacterized protein BKA67DRAFT_380322 [Truncatella angustata]KAH6649075.1 hypothetical protein BKA67DRAFT_380322 [Truncatella angustata]
MLANPAPFMYNSLSWLWGITSTPESSVPLPGPVVLGLDFAFPGGSSAHYIPKQAGKVLFWAPWAPWAISTLANDLLIITIFMTDCSTVSS